MKRQNLFVSAVVVLAAVLSCGCSNPQAVTKPDPVLTAAGQIVLRAAIRHGVSDYVDKHGTGTVAQINAVVNDLLAVLDSDSSTTLAALKELAYSKIPPNFSPMDRQDAHDLIDLVALAIQPYISDGQLSAKAIVDLRDVLGTISYAVRQFGSG